MGLLQPGGVEGVWRGPGWEGACRQVNLPISFWVAITGEPVRPAIILFKSVSRLPI